MAALTLGDFVFETDDLPEKIPLGGDQMIAVMTYPGGHKEVQVFGAVDQNPTWQGTFNYSNALDKVHQLDKMYRSGNVYPLQIGTLMTRYGVIKKFHYDYRNDWTFDYDIEIELAPQKSLLAPAVSASSTSSPTGAPTSSGTSSPTSDEPAPQRTYVVVSGDSLWSIAAKSEFYGDGSQWRKIATANNIQNADDLQIGTKLVIP